MRQKIHDIVHQYVKRDGINDMLQWYDNNGFYEAWASTSFHCNYKGGLAEHTYNVIANALKLADVLKSEVSRESIVLCALLHDAGKCNYYVPNLLKSGKTSGSKPMKINPGLRIKNHAFRSLMIVSKFLELTESERICILCHDGFFENSNREYMLSLDELLYIVHSADLYAARFMEPVKDYKRGEEIDL